MEKRTERINTRVLPSIKAMAEQMAASDGRTLSNYIENLILEDFEERKPKMRKSARSMGFIPAYGGDTSIHVLTLGSGFTAHNYYQKLVFDDGTEISTSCSHWTESPVMRKYARYGVREIIPGYNFDTYRIAEIPDGLKPSSEHGLLDKEQLDT